MNSISRISAVLTLSFAAFGQSSRVLTLIQQGQTALDGGDFEHAVADFQQARELAPDSLKANRGLVLSYLQAGDLRDAAQVGTEALSRWPNDAQLQHWLGLVHFKAGQNARAQDLLEQSAKTDGRHFDIHFDLSRTPLHASGR